MKKFISNEKFRKIQQECYAGSKAAKEGVLWIEDSNKFTCTDSLIALQLFLCSEKDQGFSIHTVIHTPAIVDAQLLIEKALLFKDLVDLLERSFANTNVRATRKQ